MEPAARTVVSGPKWPMRAGVRGRAASGHPPGGSGRAGIRSAPTGGGKGPCARVPQGAQPGAAWRAFGLAPWYIVGGSDIALIWLLQGDSGATQCGALHESQPTTGNGRSEIWRHNYSHGVSRPTAKTMRIKLTQPRPRLLSHCNDVI